MRKLLPLLALFAVPAAAQEARVYYASDLWPVEASGGVCSMARDAGPDSDPFTVSYDAASDEVTLSASTDAVATSMRESSAVDLWIVFLDNGRTAHDDAWGPRRFTFTRDGDTARFSTRFKGERNVRQILDDLGNSHDVGFLYDGEPVVSANLADAGSSLGKLRECARRVIAAN